MPHFWLQLVSAVLSIVTGVLFIRNPGVAVTTLALLLVIFFMVEGIAKVVFALTRAAAAELGLDAGRAALIGVGARRSG